MSFLEGAAILSRAEMCNSRPATERLASCLRARLVEKWTLWSIEDHILSCDVRLGLEACVNYLFIRNHECHVRNIFADPAVVTILTKLLITMHYYFW